MRATTTTTQGARRRSHGALTRLAAATLYAALGVLVAAMAASAQPAPQPPPADWRPDRPVRLIVPFPPGAATDLLARLLAERASRDLPHRWVVENRAGANGNIGMEAVARAAPDGLTLGACTVGNCAINAAIYARMPYDPARDLAPVFFAASVVNVLAVHPSVPAADLRGFLAWAAARPGAVNYGSSGFGASNHVGMELLNGLSGARMVHVPFRGGAPAFQALLSGQVQAFFENAPVLIEPAREGRIRALAVAGTERLAALPDVPTFAEAGVPGVLVGGWFGYMAPRGTPEPTVRTLNALFQAALDDPETRARITGLSLRPEGGPPDRFGAHVASEVARWAAVVRDNGVERLTE